MGEATRATVAATLRARGLTGPQAAQYAEDWHFAAQGDDTIAAKWLASTSVALHPTAVENKVRPAGTTVKGKNH